MGKQEASQLTSSKSSGKRNLFSVLLQKGNLKGGCPLGYVLHGNILAVGIGRPKGIECCCGCQETYSITQFELHAGSRQKKGSALIILLDGSLKSLAFLRYESELAATSEEGQSSASSNRTLQEKTTSCDLCLNKDDVFSCSTPSCPAGLHAWCSEMQDVLNGQWYCQKCTCRKCQIPLRGNQFENFKKFLVICALCGDEYHMSCASDSGSYGYDINMEWFCSDYCEKGFKILEDQISTPIDSRSPFKFSLVRWKGGWKGCQGTVSKEGLENEEDKDAYSVLLEQKGTQAKKLFQAMHILMKTFMGESSVCNQTDLFKQMLYPNEGKSSAEYLDHYGFYIMLLEKDGEVLTVATIRIHSQEVAEMPFITTVTAHRGKGFCQQLIEYIQKILLSIGVRQLVVQSTQDDELQSMWVQKYSMQPVQGDDKRFLLKSNLQKLEGRTLFSMNLESSSEESYDQKSE